MHPVAVALAGPDAGQVAVPVERGALDELVPGLAFVGVEEAELDSLGCSEKSEKFVPRPSQVAPSGKADPARPGASRTVTGPRGRLGHEPEHGERRQVSTTDCS